MIGVNFTHTIHHDTYPAVNPLYSTDMVGKHVFVTGASRGIGKAMAIAFAQAGASVVGIAARSNLLPVKAEIEEAAALVGRDVPRIIIVTADVLSRESLQQAVEEITPQFDNKLDILVNNAGYMETWKPVIEADPEDWWHSWEVNIKGQFLVCHAMLPLLLASESGLKTMVNISSIGGQMCSPGASAYQTARFAILRLTEILNAEYGRNGLIAYCMNPGAVKTALAWKMPERIRENLTDTPELMASTIVFLTQKRREWLRGRYVSCTWDMPEMFAKEKEIVEKDMLKMRMVV
jgi:NAD(P)-dependent dehydrogenase (short-subunit alcohol dehydrogenase family)